MKKSAYILLPLVSLGILTGCSADPATAVEGEYTLEAQSVQINGVIINMGDWPGASVSIAGTGESSADVSIDSLLLGFEELSMPCEVSRTDRDKYSFYGAYSGQDREIELNGSVNKGRLSLSITDLYTTEAAGRWRPSSAEDGLADLHITFESTAISGIPLGDTTISLETAVALANTALRTALTPVLDQLDYMELSRTGYINIAWSGDISDALRPLLQDVIQYWPDPEQGQIHLYLRRTLTDGLGLPVSPLDVPAGCTVSGSDMTLTLDKTALKPFADILLSAAGDLNYSDYTEAGSPLGDLTETQFDEYKALLPLIQGVLAMPSTTYGAEITFEKTE